MKRQLYAPIYPACSHPEFLSSVGPRRNKKARLTHGPIATKALAAAHWLRLASTGCASDWAATDEFSVGSDYIRENRKHRELENRHSKVYDWVRFSSLSTSCPQFGLPDLFRFRSDLLSGPVPVFGIGTRPLLIARGVPGTGTPRAMDSACGLFASAHQIGLDELVQIAVQYGLRVGKVRSRCDGP